MDKTDRYYIVPPSEGSVIKTSKSRKKKKTKRDEILEEIRPLYYKALNSGNNWINEYNDSIIDYILRNEKK